MKKKLILALMLAVLSAAAGFSQTRTVLFHEPFRGPDDAEAINSQSNPGETFGGNADNWAINNELGYNVYTMTNLGDGSFSTKISRDAYEGASGGSYSETRTWGRKYFAFNFVNSELYRNVWFETGVVNKIDGLVIEYATSIAREWIKLAYTAADVEVIEGLNSWKYVRVKKSLPSVLNLHIRISTTASANQQAIDDIRITAERDYGFDLKRDIPLAEELLETAVEGYEFGMYFAGVPELKAALAEGQRVMEIPDGGYTYEESKVASEALTAALELARKSKITTVNSPKINSIPAQPIKFLNGITDKATVILSGIEATSGAAITTVTARAKNGSFDVNVTGSGETRTLEYGNNVTTFDRDTIIVTVTQDNTPLNGSEKIEMSFAVEVLKSGENAPPRFNDIANVYNLPDNAPEQTITITGITAPDGDGSSVVSVTAVGIANLAVDYVAGATTAMLKFTPNLLSTDKSKALTITVTAKDNGGLETSKSFVVYIYNHLNPPAKFDAPDAAHTTIYIHSGATKLILPNVAGIEEASDFEVEVLSGARLFAEAPTVEYASGQRFAFLKVVGNGMPGTARLRISISDWEQVFDLNFIELSNPGIELQVHDAVNWQHVNVVATGAAPLYTEVYKDGYGASWPNHDNAFWNGKWESFYNDWTIAYSGDTCLPAPKINLGTLVMKGFFIPETSGIYEFSITTNDEFTAGLWFDAGLISWKSAACIARAHGRSQADCPIGTFEDVDGGRVISATYALEAGKAYPMYSVRWFTHEQDWTISYKGPGVATWTTIPEKMLSPLYDLTKPTAPAGVKIHTTMAERILLEWQAVAVQRLKVARIVGYNIYANGKKNNTELVTNTTFLLEGLTGATNYDVFVTAVDELGNESVISNVENTTTLASSATPPAKPAAPRAEAKTGEVLKMRWERSAGIVAYDISVDGAQYNSEKIYADSVFIRKLTPETEYAIRIRAYNGSLVVSDWSDAVKVATGEFDPLAGQLPGFNEHRVNLNIDLKNSSWAQGVGINGSFKDGSLFENGGDNNLKKAIDALKPGIVRWGNLDANKYGLVTVTGPDATAAANPDTYYKASIGKARKELGLATHAINMDYCNSIEAYYAISVGVKDGPKGSVWSGFLADDWTVDYMHPETGYKAFLKLIEYLAGSATSVYGAIRAEEGFSEPVLVKGKSRGIILEFGNEVWGSGSHDAHIGADYDIYGKWCRAMADSIRTSPYWNEVKDLIQFAYSGRDPSISSLNDNVVRGAKPGQVGILALSGYLGGNLDYEPAIDYGQTLDQYYRLRYNHVAYNLQGMQALMKKQIQMIGTPLNAYFYEGQVSTSYYYGNLGQAVVLLDYFTASMKYGGVVPSIYDYSNNEWRIQADNKPFAHYEMARLVNTYCKGHLVKSTVATNNQAMVDLTWPEIDFRPILGFDPVGTSVYNNGNKWSILLFSRDFSNEYSVRINLPEGIGEIKNVKRHVVGGNTEKGFSIRLGFDMIEDEPSTLKSGDIVYVPPYSMVLYTFEAGDPKFEALPLGHFERVKPQALELTGTPSIIVDGGNTKITPVVTPDDAFAQNVIWTISETANKEIIDAGLPFPLMSATPDAVTLRAKGTSTNATTIACNGSFWLTATLADNLAVSKSILITLTNQTSGCEYPELIGVDDVATKATVLFYPNPASETLFVKTNTDAFSTVTIYSSIGVRVMAETSSEQVVELNVASLPAGQYTAVIESNGKAESVIFLKK